jgi:hypothetical protein
VLQFVAVVCRCRLGLSTELPAPTLTLLRVASRFQSLCCAQPMAAIRALLSQYPIKTRVSLTGTLVVARDIAHAKLQERIAA